MCTIILAYQLHPQMPVLLGANRDERLSRPAEGFKLRKPTPIAAADAQQLSTLAPKDLKAGGTWIGINEHGVLAAITNRFGAQSDPGRRSRGELVDRALEHTSSAGAAEVIYQLNAREYNGFHLLIVDQTSAHVVWNDSQYLHHEQLDPGIDVFTERSFGAAENLRQQKVLRRCQALHKNGILKPETLAEVLSEREDGSIDATSVRIEEMDYGTRSSSIIQLGQAPLFWHTDQPPEPAGYLDDTALLKTLLETGPNQEFEST